MKISALALSGLLTLPIIAQAQSHHPRDNGEAFDAIVSSVDATTAAELSASQMDIQALRDELSALRNSDGADPVAVERTRENLRDARSTLSEQVRSIVEGDDELRAELRASAHAAREDHLASTFALRNDEARADVLAAASADEAVLISSNQASIDSLRSEIQSARDAGATRDDTTELREELQTVSRAQRDLVGNILDTNENLQADILSSAQDTARDIRANRQDTRQGFRDGRGSRPDRDTRDRAGS